MKKNLIIILVIVCMKLSALAIPQTSVTYVIDPEKNAYEHNNMGIVYLEEKDYFAAIQEFKMAISLNPKTQATSVYFNNLGKVYMTIGYPNLALDCFNNALTQYNLNFEYYQNLANCYKETGVSGQKLAQYKKRLSSPLDKIMLGLLYEQEGNKKKAIIVLDDFATTEPNLIITSAVKNHIKKLVKEINEEE